MKKIILSTIGLRMSFVVKKYESGISFQTITAGIG
jgi:hypothetical protein